MSLQLLKTRGALNEAAEDATAGLNLMMMQVPREVLQLVPAPVATVHTIFPLAFDGETLTVAAADAENIALADKLRFLLAKNVRLVPASRDVILHAIAHHYPPEATLDLLEDNEISFGDHVPARARKLGRVGEAIRYLGKGIVENKCAISGSEDEFDRTAPPASLDPTPSVGGEGMFFFTVEEGQRVLMRRPNGTMEVLVGPRRVWRGLNSFAPMQHHVAYPGTFLVVRYRDGRQQHLPGPADLWFDPREHLEVSRQEGLQLAAKEAVVVYSKAEGSDRIARRIVYGPALFVPSPGEWLHTFSWHASRGGHRGVQKEPNALVFQKLWLMPDQMYHDVVDVRTADDAVLTVRLMIFFELTDIERMLDETHDPIGDFVNAATSDVVSVTSRHDFESFKRNTNQLNELEAYRQLTGRATQCGYRINKVVYRGYGAAEALQLMHDQAIQARTRLQLDRATEQQAQELENYKLDAQLARAGKRRGEQTNEVEHELELNRHRQEAEIRQREAQAAAARERLARESELRLSIRRGQDAQQGEHLAALRNLGVDLTAYLTQARADRVIELRGGADTHIHLDSTEGNGVGQVS